MRSEHDFLVIGGGNAGVAVAGVARAAGLSVAIVEPREFGGTCPNRGCTPKKVLVAAADAVDHLRRVRGHGVEGQARIDWPALQRQRTNIVAPIGPSIESSLRSRGVTIVRGAARFVARHEVAVGDAIHHGKKIVIATGSIPRPLSVPGHEHITHSDQALEMDAVPETAVFIGAGVIALELSHVLVRAGCQRVVVLEVMQRALPALDPDAVDALVNYGRGLGIDVVSGVKIEAIERTDAELRVRYRDGAGRTLDVSGARVFHGAGRVANLGGLDVEKTGLSLERGGVALQPDLRTTADSDIAIVGDAAPGLPQLSPLATSLGRRVGTNLVEGRHDAPDVRFVPSCVFTLPTLAQVGLTEARADEAGVEVEVRRTEGINQWISARMHHEEVAFAKVLVEKGTQRIVGAHLLGHGAEGNIHLFALAMRAGISAPELAAMDAAFPTPAADIKHLL